MTDSQTAQKALDKAKIQFMAKPDTAFFTTICFSMKHSFDPSIETAQTNGTHIRYNPKFFMDQTPAQQLGLMIHETMHVAYGHCMPSRMGEKNMVKWNQACDYVINDQILSRGFELPKGGLHDPQYKGMSAEQIYKLLPDPPEPPPSGGAGEQDEDGGGGASGNAPGQGEQPPAPPESHIAPPSAGEREAQAHLDDILVRASIQSKASGDAPGTIPGELELYIDRLLRPKLPSRQLLKRFFDQMKKADYSWRRPNKRYMPDFYLPSLHSEEMGHIAIAVDSSGSVTDEEFQRFVSETANIIRRVKPSKISLITFDARIQSVSEIRTMRDLMRVRFTGRGGTAIAPVLEWEAKNRPRVMMVFSDGHFYFHSNTETRRKTPFLWLIHDNSRFKAPFGRVIHYDLD